MNLFNDFITASWTNFKTTPSLSSQLQVLKLGWLFLDRSDAKIEIDVHFICLICPKRIKDSRTLQGEKVAVCANVVHYSNRNEILFGLLENLVPVVAVLY